MKIEFINLTKTKCFVVCDMVMSMSANALHTWMQFCHQVIWILISRMIMVSDWAVGDMILKIEALEKKGRIGMKQVYKFCSAALQMWNLEMQEVEKENDNSKKIKIKKKSLGHFWFYENLMDMKQLPQMMGQ